MSASVPTNREASLKRFEDALNRISHSIVAGDASDEVVAYTAERAEAFAKRMEFTEGGRLWA